ncbi:MAG: tyrosine-type recombinase/integrase [Pyrinomonadaceae bacterium]
MKYSMGVAPKRRNGKLVGYDGYLHYYDESGKRKSIHRERKGKSEAREAIRIELNKLEDHGPKALEGTVTTFAELADYCEKEIYVEAEYNEAGEKLSGVRDVSTYKAHLKHSRAFFGTKKLEHISVADLKRYRSHRLRCTRRGPNETEINISPGTVARELTTLRAMFYEAKRNQWIKQNPFEFARKNEIIKSSDRKKRNLFLTFDQEIKLLKACETEDRRHLRALIIVAVDTGARFGELINLTKCQIDFRAGKIHGLLNYKDLGGDKQLRNASMTVRVREALLDIINNPGKKAFRQNRAGKKPSDQLVFGVSDNVRTAWAGALEDSGLSGVGLHFHDLRHTPGTRVQKLISMGNIANALGHKDPKTTAQVYVNHTEEDLDEFAKAVEQAVEAGYKQAMSDDAMPDQESTLIS